MKQKKTWKFSKALKEILSLSNLFLHWYNQCPNQLIFGYNYVSPILVMTFFILHIKTL
jgi:hypothetical protein